MPRAMREEGRTLESVDRALALLDALAELPSGRPRERARAAHRHQPEHGLATARDAHGPGLRRSRRRDGALPPRPAPGRLRGRRPGRPRRADDRAAAPRAPRRADGGDRDAVRPRGHPAVHDRLRPQPVERRQPRRARPAQRHARDGHREAPARLRPAAPRAPRSRALRALHRSHPDDPGRARRGRSIACAPKAWRTVARSARRASTRSGRRCSAASRRSTRCSSIQGPASRLHVRRMPGLASELREAADAVGAALGGRA